VGVLSGVGTEPTTGYLVEGSKAVACLAAHSPRAAAWWRANAPHVLSSGYQLFFPTEVCEKRTDGGEEKIAHLVIDARHRSAWGKW
jgi:hypothetical protein